MRKNLFFLEDPKKINQIIQDSEKIAGHSVYISLSPAASYAFEKTNLTYKSVRDYRGGEERYQQGLENFQRIERIVTILDKELEHLHEVPELTPARYAIFNLKILIDVLFTAVQVLKTIIDTEKPDHIHLYTIPAPSLTRTYAFSNDESVYAEILNMPGWNIPVDIIRDMGLETQCFRTPSSEYSFISRFQTWIMGYDILFNLGLIAKRAGIRTTAMAVYHYLFSIDRQPVLIYNSGYNWDDSLDELHRAGMVPVYRIRDEEYDTEIIRNGKYDNYRREVFSICTLHPDMREFNKFLGIDISSFLFERLSEIIGRSIQESIVVYPHAREMIRRRKIRCLLISVRERAIGHVIVQAAHDERIPVISWQHGGAGYCYHPMMPFIEFINSDWHFVFGEEIAESYRSTSERIGLEKIPIFVPVGSSSLDYFRKCEKKSLISQADRPIVYVTTNYLKNVYFISQPSDPADWDQHLWAIQRQILNLAKENPEKQFIIKLHSSHKDKEPISDYIKDHEIKNIEIITSEQTLRELADRADIMIFDLISTGILQVLTSDLPIFVHTGLHAIEPNTIRQLQKRAYVYDDTEDFTAGIGEYFKAKKGLKCSADCSDENFLLGYGTDIHTCTSAERGVKKLKEILTAKK
jgi:hypothetical protein